MHIILTVCAGILSASPGCTSEDLQLLREVTPQQCIQKGQERLAQEHTRLAFTGLKVVRWECKRG